MTKKRNNKLTQLAVCAMLIALATVLGMIKLFNLPAGGSITLFSMLAATLCGYYFGVAKGLLACVALGLVNFILEPVMVHPAQVFLDYILAFGLMGLSGLTSNKKNGLTTGYIIGICGRFLGSFLSGFIFFGSYAPEGMNPVLYSFLYQLSYIGVEGIITIAVINVPVVKNTLTHLKSQLNQS